MSLNKRNILGVGVTIAVKGTILEEIEKYLTEFRIQNSEFRTKRIKPLIIYTPNPEIIMYAQKDAKFMEIVNSAQINITDGIGLCWALKMKYGLVIKRISGVGLMDDLCKLAGRKGFTVGLIGGRGGVALQTSECLRKTYPGLKVEVLGEPEVELRIKSRLSGIPQAAGNIESGIVNKKIRQNFHNSYFIIHNSSGKKIDEQQYFQNLIMEINRKKIDLLFAALGFPKQEYFIDLIRKQLLITNYQLPIILMSVGGAFDYISGRVKRAPIWMRERGLEWLYRLINDPSRLGRQIRGAEFFLRVLIPALQ